MMANLKEKEDEAMMRNGVNLVRVEREETRMVFHKGVSSSRLYLTWLFFPFRLLFILNLSECLFTKIQGNEMKHPFHKDVL